MSAAGRSPDRLVVELVPWQIFARMPGTVNSKVEQLCLRCIQGTISNPGEAGICQIIQVHRSFGLPHFLEQHVPFCAGRQCRGLIPNIFRPCNDAIPKSELMVDAPTLGHGCNSSSSGSLPFDKTAS
jgi:hypothetical protein